MTPNDPRLGNQDCDGNAAAYALRALDPSEAAQFLEHLETCIVCRDEIAAFGQIADALAMSVPQRPVPRSVRRRIMREIRAEPRTAAQPSLRGNRLSPFSRRPAARPSLVLGLLAAAALALIGGLALAPSGSSGTRIIQARVNGPAGSARVSLTGARAELSVSRLPPPSGGRVYELWIERNGHAPSPTALFSVNASGAAEVGVPGGLRGASTIMVTQERAGGSLVPTQRPVIVARIS